ncbi:hypothetical protein KIL84_005462 [Mauremys mutica]|uniref:Uncharacterized protein n=1 Tax=Mauremys mutica TaxID=74926 RepID=A0A9D3XKZ4_9SAUR|nr:hypothetical protein KIL84_005462 [Mauremys mutica]
MHSSLKQKGQSAREHLGRQRRAFSQTFLLPSTEASLVKITAVWIMPEFISQFIKEARVFYFFFRFAQYKWNSSHENKPGFCSACITMEGGKEEEDTPASLEGFSVKGFLGSLENESLCTGLEGLT